MTDASELLQTIKDLDDPKADLEYVERQIVEVDERWSEITRKKAEMTRKAYKELTAVCDAEASKLQAVRRVLLAVLGRDRDAQAIRPGG